MNVLTPPSINYVTGKINAGNLVEKVTLLSSLDGIFADKAAYASLPEDRVIYSVEMLPAESAEGELNFGVSHIEAGSVGDEFFMTRGHFHERIEQAEYYFGSAGEGLLILQTQTGAVTIEKVVPGSIHHIGGSIAHRLVNTGNERLSALAVWPSIAGHNYDGLKVQGFNVRVMKDEGGFIITECF
ncbi:glucose-6-phosphate isomerase [Photobacterium frigidiphilum]|uniref:glucose-6-phosphate isomerase n=1 Tax=Photobacterium frigidiphilum TaxID=264736 RepID=A0A2T3J7K2_9GAMM|nr:glucose-6-phosphate isomerase family protein [Photobacterium frigidiphilum]PSU44735.1 glucose-6-phosphate isomerase [Photobacterium frigidiphilum]